MPFDYGAFEAKCRRIATSFDRSFFEATRGVGHRDGAPIFIGGMPRSGSTLVEQILASHSCVEGTMELPNVLNYVREFDHLGVRRDAYPESARSRRSADGTSEKRDPCVRAERGSSTRCSTISRTSD